MVPELGNRSAGEEMSGGRWQAVRQRGVGRKRGQMVSNGSKGGVRCFRDALFHQALSAPYACVPELSSAPSRNRYFSALFEVCIFWVTVSLWPDPQREERERGERRGEERCNNGGQGGRGVFVVLLIKGEKRTYWVYFRTKGANSATKGAV